MRTFFRLLIITITFLFIRVSLAVGNSDSEKIAWSVQEGWVYKNGEPFLAIGTWGIPGYDPRFSGDDLLGNEAIFEKASDRFNIIHTLIYRQHSYMKDTILLSGNGLWKWRFLEGYNGHKSMSIDQNSNKIIDFNEMKYIRDHLDSYYTFYIENNIVEEMNAALKDYNFVWLLPDEAANARDWSWYWSPEVLQSYYNAIKFHQSSSLVLLDLLGGDSGNHYLFEEAYRNRYGHQPTKLDRGKEYLGGKPEPENWHTFKYCADGTPVYDPQKGWKKKPKKMLADNYYDNIKVTSQAYDAACDVISINNYLEFFDDPKNAGIAVDAFKAGCGATKPVWPFFDGNMFLVRNKSIHKIAPSAYAQNVRCQIYTALVHGATGVLFWTRPDLDELAREYWPKIEAIADELNNQAELIKMPAIIEQSNLKNDVQWVVKSDGLNTAIFVVNTSKEQKLPFHWSGTKLFPDSITDYLDPLDVRVFHSQIK